MMSEKERSLRLVARILKEMSEDPEVERLMIKAFFEGEFNGEPINLPYIEGRIAEWYARSADGGELDKA